MPRARHRQHGNPFHVRPPSAVEWDRVFARRAPFALDVGFGPGSFLLELARRHPEWNVLGLEIRPHWVEGVLVAAAEAGLGNLHALVANANLHLDELLPDESLVFVSLNFPDPWFKRRHQKRRVLNREWLDLMARKLQPGAVLHYASDFGPGALEALALLRQHPRFASVSGVDDFAATSTTGIESERERTHLRRGETIWRLAYSRLAG